jgi:hypothetical protein
VHLVAFVLPLQELFLTKRYQTGKKNSFSAEATAKCAHWSDSAARELEKLAPLQLRSGNSRCCPREPTAGMRAGEAAAELRAVGQAMGEGTSEEAPTAMEEMTTAMRQRHLAATDHGGAPPPLWHTRPPSSCLPPFGSLPPCASLHRRRVQRQRPRPRTRQWSRGMQLGSAGGGWMGMRP